MTIEVKQDLLSPGVLQDLELIEAASWNEMYEAADKYTRRDCGLQSMEFKGSLLLVASKIDVFAFNRVVGWGVNQPATEADIDFFKEKFKIAGVPRFMIQVSPFAAPAEANIWLQQQGFELHNNWVKLYRETGETPHPTSDFKIVEAKKSEAQSYANIVTEAFQWPEQINFLIASLINRKNWKHYVAYEDNEPVATGSMFIRDEYAWFCFAATMPGYRAKGAQTALIQKRIEVANAAGCRHILVETADDKGGNPSPSGRNLMRMGFKQLYKRPNFIYHHK
jgi:GNAT superfamily N-acetyltransferase